MTDSAAAATVAPEPARPAERLMSLDALRGFVMFWIVGADALGHALGHFDGGPLCTFLATQMDHVAWEGFHFYDLIFPLFAFMIGVAITFSLTKISTTEGRPAAVRRILRRTLLLYLLGLFYYGGLSTSVDHIRFVGVLQRLAIAYGGAALLFLYLKPRGLVGAVLGILLGYWALLAWVPIRDIRLESGSLAALAEQQGQPEAAAALRKSENPSIDPDRRAWTFAQQAFAAATNRVSGHYEPGYNLVNHLDFTILPGRKWDGFYDPEGLLSNLPAIATALLGVLAGIWLREPNRGGIVKTGGLALAGIACLGLGFLWGTQFPVVKKLWSSSYVLVAGGYSLLFLAAFFLVIDIWKIRGWAQPFVWIGANALTIYLMSNIVDFGALSARFAGGDVSAFLDRVWPGLGTLVLALIGATLCILICRFLYRRKVFLRL